MSGGFGVPNRLHRSTALLGPVRRLRGFVIPVVAIVVIGGTSERMLGLLIPLAIVVLTSLVGEVVRYLRFRWWIDGDRLEVRGGLLRREERSVPIERIQSVGVDSDLLARIFSVAAVRVETAGGTGPEIELRYIDRTEADRLRTLLLRADGPGAEADSGAGETTVKMADVRVPNGELVIAGATSNRIGALAVAIGAVLGNLDSFGIDPVDWLRERLPETFDPEISQIAIVVGAIGLTAVVVGWVVSIVGTVTNFYGFELHREGDRLRRSHGLLSTVSSSTPLSRVQGVRIDRPLLRRMVARASVAAETAGSPGDDAGGSGVLTPITRDRDVDDVVRLALPAAPAADHELRAVHPLALRRGRLRAGLLGLPAVAALWITAGLPWAAGFAAGWAALSWWYGSTRYRALGFAVDGVFLRSRAGVLNRRTWVIPLRAVQEVSVSRTPFQRRLGLADLVIRTAAASLATVRIVDLAVETARGLAVEAADIAEQTALVDAV